MKLPEDIITGHKTTGQKVPKWLVALCIFTLFVSFASMAFSAAALVSIPQEVSNYVAEHKQGLKGEKGDTGPMGPQGFTGVAGRNGANSYSPTHCYSSELFGSVTTNCY